MVIKIGDLFNTKYGACKVIDYIDFNNVTIKFIKTKSVRVVNADKLRRGNIKDYHIPNVCSVGYLGTGKYDRTNIKLYYIWYGMLTRCYSKKYQSKYPTYKGCVVVDRWHNFQLFCQDIVKMPNYSKKGFELDKDLRKLGNKTYGPAYCSFVPQQINAIFGSSTKENKTGHLGIKRSKSRVKPYILTIKRNGVTYTKTFCSPKKAYKYYLKLRLKHVHTVAEKYKTKLHVDVHNNISTMSLQQLHKLIRRNIVTRC